MSSLYSSFYKNTPGLQVKRDMDFSNVTIQCDPRLVVPDTPTTQTSGIFKKDTAGKIAVEHEICDLDVSNLTVSANLTVSGNLIANGIAEVCDIVCPVDFNLTAGNNINETAAANMNLNATAGTITGTAGGAISLTSSSDSINIQSTGLLPADGSINLTSSDNTTGTGGQIVLTAGATTNNFNNSGVEVFGNNIRSVDPTSAVTSGASLNVFPRVPGAKGLSVVCKDSDANKFGIAADLTGTTVFRADGTTSNTGATGHLISAPSGVDLLTFSPNAVDVTLTDTINASAVGVVGNCSDTCGTVFVTAIAASTPTKLTVTFAKRFPTQYVNIQITAADKFGASCTDVWSGSVFAGAPGSIQATGFTLNFLSGPAAAEQDCIFHYFVMDVVAPATQIG